MLQLPALLAHCTLPALPAHSAMPAQGRTQRGADGAGGPLNGNRLNTNMLLTFVKTRKNSAHAYIAI